MLQMHVFLMTKGLYFQTSSS